jgi:hypothetical protein
MALRGVHGRVIGGRITTLKHASQYGSATERHTHASAGSCADAEVTNAFGDPQAKGTFTSSRGN